MDKKAIARAAGIPSALAFHLIDAPWWGVFAALFAPSVLTAIYDFCRWVSGTRPGCYLGTFFALLITFQRPRIARDMATRHAFAEKELHKLAASDSKPTKNLRSGRSGLKAVPEPSPQIGNGRHAKSAANAAAPDPVLGDRAPDPAELADPGPPDPDPGRRRTGHLNVAQPDL